MYKQVPPQSALNDAVGILLVLLAFKKNQGAIHLVLGRNGEELSFGDAVNLPLLGGFADSFQRVLLNLLRSAEDPFFRQPGLVSIIVAVQDGGRHSVTPLKLAGFPARNCKTKKSQNLLGIRINLRAGCICTVKKDQIFFQV